MHLVQLLWAFGFVFESSHTLSNGDKANIDRILAGVMGSHSLVMVFSD